MKNSFPGFQQEKVLYARLKSANVDLSSSDWLRPEERRMRGNSVCLYISQGTPEEVKAFFDKLSLGAEITDPLKHMPYGLYGALNDRFGVRWMFHADAED